MRDAVSQLRFAILGNATTLGNGEGITKNVIDTADSNQGLALSFLVADEKQGNVVLEIIESDDPDTGFSPVKPESIIGDLSTVLDNVAYLGDKVRTIGLFSTKRYIKARTITTDAPEDASNGAIIFAYIGAEVLPNV